PDHRHGTPGDLYPHRPRSAAPDSRRRGCCLMSSSTLDLVPREHHVRGTGSNAEPPAWIPPPVASSALGHMLARAARPDYIDWLSHVQAAAGCTRPVRLTGDLYTVARQ